MAEMVLVRKKDLVKVIEKADDTVSWGSSSWKARKRLIEAIGGMEECYRCVTGSLKGAPDDAFICSSCAHGLTSTRTGRMSLKDKTVDYGTDYCCIPDCGCAGDPHP